MNFTGDVPTALDGQRLDRVVAMISGCSRTEATLWVEGGRVKVDDVVTRTRAARLAVGMRIEIDLPTAADARPSPDPDVRFGVVHVDEHFVVVDKPAGLVVHPGSGHPDGTLVNGLLARFPGIADVGEPQRPGIVHRLDRGTSGLLVVARSAVAYQSLVAALAARTVHREYSALVHGHPSSERGLVDAPIGRSPRDATKMAVVRGGKSARTHYEVLDRYREPVVTALLRCELETGRTHQIRVHLAAIDHPVIGDTQYGGSTRGLDLTRPFLHARALAFEHPVTKQHLAFVSELPADLAGVLSALES